MGGRACRYPLGLESSAYTGIQCFLCLESWGAREQTSSGGAGTKTRSYLSLSLTVSTQILRTQAPWRRHWHPIPTGARPTGAPRGPPRGFLSRGGRWRELAHALAITEHVLCVSLWAGPFTLAVHQNLPVVSLGNSSEEFGTW